jgi:2-(3-amino-3-carboxypropyl)histidine synthase
MKTLFIPTYSRRFIDKFKILEISKKLPKSLAIVYSSQYKIQAIEIKKILSKNHDVSKFTQVLGCSKLEFPKAKAILLISDGRFHAVSLAQETNMPIYIINNKLEKISEKEINEFKQKQKASYVKFLNAKNIGILVSTKPGQQNLKKAIIARKILKKNSYLFLCNNINNLEFENFPDIQSWVNTACPRLDMNDANIINLINIKS